MTTSDIYPIHRCIYRNDQAALKELLKSEEMIKRINECDNHGNTPIHLALMLDRRNCVITLLNNKCDVFTRNSCGWNPLDEAIMIGDIDIIEKISYLKWREIVNKFSGPGGILDEWTSVLPNLYLKYKISIKTTIPLLQKLGARDIEEIYKKGSSFRFNTTVTGIDSRGIPKFLRGSISIIGKRDEKSGVYRIILLDNKKKIYQEFFPNIPQWYLNNSLKSKIGVNTLYKFYVDINNFSVKQKKSSVIKKTKKSFALSNGSSYKTELFKTKNFKLIIRKRKDEAIIGDCKSDIKTKVSKDDEISSIFKKFEEQSGSVSKNKLSKEDDDDNDSDSDDESTCSEDDLSISVNYNSIFKKYINETNPELSESNPEVVNKIISILQKGYDDDNNKVTNNDIEYLDKYTPDILRTYIAKKSSDTNHKKYQYLNYTATNNSQKINCSVSKDGNTKTYEIADGTKDTLDWETAYNMRYPQGNDIFYEMVTGNLQDNLEHNSELKSKTSYTKGDIITEDQYFDPSSTEKFHMGRIMSINDEVKYFKNVSKCWMSKEGTFPINLDQLSPLVKFANFVIFDELSQINKNSFEMALYERFIEIMKKDLQGDRRFPLKIVFPVFPSIKAQGKTLDVSVDPEKIPDELFEIPSDYQYGNVYFTNIH
eukprot:jgi/Orpsp1_1/1178771/evm.model.c7180000066685.1